MFSDEWRSGLSTDKLVFRWWCDLLLAALFGSLYCPECGILTSTVFQLLCVKASLIDAGCGLCGFPWGVPWVGLEHVPCCVLASFGFPVCGLVFLYPFCGYGFMLLVCLLTCM